MIGQNLQEMMGKITKEIHQKTEEMVLSQLGDLVKKGLLVWEEGAFEIFQSPIEPGKFSIGVTGRLVLKDKEYIQKLESENAEMKVTLRTLANYQGPK